MSPFQHKATYQDKPVEVATKLWPPEATNYWFPNWKELFHGFSVVQNRKTNEIYEADSTSRRNVMYSQTQNFGSPLQYSHCSGPDKANTSILRPCSFQQTRQEPLQAHDMKNTQEPVPNPVLSHNGAPLSSQQVAKDQKQSRTTIEVCSPIQAPGIITKCTTQSPQWLPEGWVTEIHHRRPGSTSSTCNKYFKHIDSGHRRRSKKDVLHFTSTGKARAKKKGVTKKVLTYFAGNSILNAFTNRKLGIIESYEFPPQIPLKHKQSAHGTTSLTLELSKQVPNTSLALPCKNSDSLYTSGSTQPPGKEAATEKAHKLSVIRSKVISSLSMRDHRETSKVWQPLIKPARVKGRSPWNPEMRNVSFRQPDVEMPKAVPDRATARNISDSTFRKQKAYRGISLSKDIKAVQNEGLQTSRITEVAATRNEKGLASNAPTSDRATQPTEEEIQTAHTEAVQMSRLMELADTISVEKLTRSSPTAERAIQLSKEIKAAHDEVVQMSREMQAAAEKLSRDILVAKKNVRLDHTTLVFHAPSGTYEEMEDKSESSNNCKLKFDTLSSLNTTSTIGDPTPQPCEVTNKPANPSSISVFRNCYATALVSSSHAAPMLPTQQALQITSMSLASVTKPAYERASSYGDIAAPVDDFTDNVHVMKCHNLMRTNGTIHSGGNDDSFDAHVSKPETQCKDRPYEKPFTWNGQTNLSHCLLTNVNDDGKAVGAEEQSSLVFAAQTSREYSATATGTQENTNSRQSLKWRHLEATRSKQLRKRKYSALSKPKLDMSGLTSALTTRQRGKEVEKMKASQARELLTTLGRHLCRDALRARR